eukprot:1007364_1
MGAMNYTNCTMKTVNQTNIRQMKTVHLITMNINQMKTLHSMMASIHRQLEMMYWIHPTQNRNYWTCPIPICKTVCDDQQVQCPKCGCKKEYLKYQMEYELHEQLEMMSKDDPMNDDDDNKTKEQTITKYLCKTYSLKKREFVTRYISINPMNNTIHILFANDNMDKQIELNHDTNIEHTDVLITINELTLYPSGYD